MTPRRRSLRSFGAHLGTAAAVAGVTAGATVAAPTQALAAPGDVSAAHAQFLQSDLLFGTLPLELLADLAGAVATSTGAATAVDYNDLNVALLGGVLSVPVDGGVNVPLPFDSLEAGLVGQFARAVADSSSLAVAGLVNEFGVVGESDMDDPPGPLRLDLSGLLAELNLAAPLVGSIADLSLTVDAVSATASQSGTGATIGTYSIDGALITLESPLLATLTTTLAARIANLQGLLDGLEALVDGAVALLDIDVTLPDLAALVNTLIGDPITSPSHPGVSVTLGTGQVIVDLDALLATSGQCNADLGGVDLPAGLNNCPVGYQLINTTTIAAITAAVTGLVSGTLTQVQTAVAASVNAVGLSGGIPVLVQVDTSIGELTDGDSDTGVSLIGVDLGGTLVGLVLAALLAPVNTITATVGTLTSGLLTPITTALAPAIDPVLTQAAQVSVNVQESGTDTTGRGGVADAFADGLQSSGRATQRALRVSVLPLANGLANIDLANATVGPNAFGAPVTTALDPTSGPEAGGTLVTITGGNFTEATAVTIDDTDADITLVADDGDGVPEPGEFVVVDDATIRYVAPANEPGPVDVIVSAPTGISNPGVYTYLAAVPGELNANPTVGPETGGTTVAISGDGLDDVSAVTVDGVAVDFVAGPGTISIVTPPHVPADVTIALTDPDGVRDVGFEYLAVIPDVTLAPASGPTEGGDTVTLTGDGLSTVTQVTVDGVPVPFVYDDGGTPNDPTDDMITFVAPAHGPGVVSVVVTNAAGSAVVTYTYVAESVPEGEPPLDASRFVPVTPCRLLDTRETNEAKPAAGSTRALQVTGRCAVPDEAISAALTLTITESDGAGHLTAWPDGTQPLASNLNFGPGENRANSTVVRLADDGSLQLYTHAATHLVADVTGYWVRSSGGTTSGRFVADAPERLLDTRLPGQTPFGPFEPRTLALPAGVPADATALAINITMDQSWGPNWFAAFPASLAERPIVSAVNSDGVGQTRAGSLIVPVSPEGFKVVSKLGGHVVVDYLGYFTGTSASMSTTGLFVPQAPDRVIDTRIAGGPIRGQQHIDITTRVPGSAVIVNLTMVQPAAPNWLRAWATGDEMPATSSVNAITEQAVANLAIIGQNESALSIFSKVDSHAIVDVAGWFYE